MDLHGNPLDIHLVAIIALDDQFHINRLRKGNETLSGTPYQIFYDPELKSWMLSYPQMLIPLEEDRPSCWIEAELEGLQQLATMCLPIKNGPPSEEAHIYTDSTDYLLYVPCQICGGYSLRYPLKYDIEKAFEELGFELESPQIYLPILQRYRQLQVQMFATGTYNGLREHCQGCISRGIKSGELISEGRWFDVDQEQWMVGVRVNDSLMSVPLEEHSFFAPIDHLEQLENDYR